MGDLDGWPGSHSRNRDSAAAKADSRLVVTLHASAFVPQHLYSRSFTFSVADVPIGSATFFYSEKDPKAVTLEMDAPKSDTFVLRIVAHEQASPFDEGSADCRPLGLALIDVAIG